MARTFGEGVFATQSALTKFSGIAFGHGHEERALRRKLPALTAIAFCFGGVAFLIYGYLNICLPENPLFHLELRRLVQNSGLPAEVVYRDTSTGEVACLIRIGAPA